jgi:hypothetical protein
MIGMMSKLLACPECGETVDMHHTTVSVFERQSVEDGDGVKIVIKGAGSITTTPLQEKEMPGRRNAVVISFECWPCRRVSHLEVRQHKGTTYLSWVGKDVPVVLEED